MEQEVKEILDQRLELVKKFDAIRHLNGHIRDLKEDFNQMDRYYRHLLLENRRHQTKIEYYQEKLEIGGVYVKTGIRIMDPNNVKLIIKEQIELYDDNTKELRKTGEKIAGINKQIQQAYQQITALYQ